MARASLLLRIGLAFVFLYAALGAFLTPANWIGFFPGFVFRVGISEGLILSAFSLFEAALALWLLSGRHLAQSSLGAAGVLAGIAAFNLGAMDIVFRDLGLMFAALALFQIAKYH